MADAPAIYTALAAVMADVQAVAKRDRNDHQKFMFRGIDAVMNAVGPALRAHQVVVVPQVHSVEYEQVQTSTGKPATACRVVVNYVFCATDGSRLEASVAGEAWDSGDKACPKAMSVAFRTALLQALCLPTDEQDPDAHTYERAPAADLSVQQKLVRAANQTDSGAVRWASHVRYGKSKLEQLDDAQATELLGALSDDAGAVVAEGKEAAKKFSE